MNGGTYYTVRVICRMSFKSVREYVKSVIQTHLWCHQGEGLRGFFAALGLCGEWCELQMCLTA